MIFFNKNYPFADPLWRKTLRAMKLITLLIFCGVMQMHAAVYSQNTFTMSESNTTVREILKKIEKSSNYTVFYRNDQVNLNNKVSVIAENSTIENVMKQVLRDQPLTFEVVDNNMVVIKSIGDKNALRDYPVTGTITDNEGEPLIGASVLIKGTTRGASTDIDGKFVLTVPGDQPVTLVVKYLGFADQEVSVNSNQRTVQVKLKADAAALEEVVVIGYGTVKKRDLTGSVASVKAEDITRIPTHNAAEAIQGRVPGADITRNSGTPGAASTITIRGNKSIASRDNLAARNGPLYVIDGFQGGDIATLNPNDIESIDILKDASSTAIYGAQGANGVIIVTTKKGAAGATKVSYNGFYGVNDYIFPDLRIRDSYIQLRREAGRTTGIWTTPADDIKLFQEPGEDIAFQNNQWINWYDLIAKTGQQQNHSITVNGGTEKTKIVASLGYFNEKGMFRNSDFNRYTGRFNLDQTINKWAKAGVQTQITYAKQNVRNNPLGQAMVVSPLGLAYNDDGSINPYPLQGSVARISPLADEVTDNTSRDNRLNTNVVANGYLELTPVKGLTFRTNLGTNFNFGKIGYFQDKQSLNRYTQNFSIARLTNTYYRYINWDNILTYNKTIKDHSLTLTGITSYLQSDADETKATGYRQPLSEQLFYSLGSTELNSREISSAYIGWNNMAYAGRLNYSYKGKYLLTMSGRFDGASRLSEGNRWDFFPSAALGWNVSDEDFFNKLKPTFSNLKLRLSYGVSGNYSVDVYGTQSVINPENRIGFGDVPAPGFIFGQNVANTGLGWEKSASTNLGLDFGFFNNRLTGTIDVYNTVTSDILMPRQLPLSTGVGVINENIGETRNRGIELTLNSTNIQKKDFRWSSMLTFSRNKEELTELLNGTDILAAERNSLLLGRPISSFYTYKKLGIWQTNEEAEAAQYTFSGTPFKPGDIKLADINNDGKIGTEDLTYIGSTVPKWIGGFQNNFSYKNLDFGVFVIARVGQTVDAEFLGRYNPSGLANSPVNIDYWTPENPTNDFPRPRWGATLSNYAGYQTLNFVEGSYFKIRNVTLGYTLPKRFSEKIAAGRVRFYATGSNLFTFTKSDMLKNYDPEGPSTDAPLSRQFVFGVNLDF